ncbi:MAG: GNAT family N-acetyltransferase [Actinomycetota bacterium]|nr:GNAT family N-acetyltransferase [Actinomycetota bacterium]
MMDRSTVPDRTDSASASAHRAVGPAHEGWYLDAVAAAAAAERAAGVTIKVLRDADQMHRAVTVLDAIWQVDASTTVIEANTLVALAHAGNYVAAALAGEEMIGVCAGFFHRPDEQALHSHIAGVLPQRAGKGVGKAIKLHQRAWAMAAGITTITWTFDPLVARNAFLNLHRLGATVSDYLVDFYGPMTDIINTGQQTDRMLVSWDLAGRPAGSEGDLPGGPLVLAIAPGGGPSPGAGPNGSPGRCRIAIPTDIESLRRRDPATAASWRVALRDTLQPLLNGGWTITDFDRSGHYWLANPKERA